MSLYVFTNRRKAKDAIMLIGERYGFDSNLMVFVREGLVYVDAPSQSYPETDMTLVMHYAELCQDKIEKFLELERTTEIYRSHGVRKFRV